MSANDIQTNDARLARIEKSVANIESALTGSMGMPGLIKLVQDHEEWRQERDKERNYQRGVIAVVGTLAGAIGGAVWKWATSHQ